MKITRSLPVLLPALLMIVIGACSDSATVSEDSGAAVADVTSPDTQTADAGPTLPDAGPAAAPWSKRFGADVAEQGNAVAVDSAGNIFVTGSFAGDMDLGDGTKTSAGSDDVFVASFSSAGALRWATRIGGVGTDKGNALAVDDSGHLFVTGQFRDTVDFGAGPRKSAGDSDVFVVGMAADSGAINWAVDFGGNTNDYGLGVAVDSAGNAVVTGEFAKTMTVGAETLESKGQLDLFIASFTAAGAPRWAKGYGAADDEHGYALALDDSDNIYVTGYYFGVSNIGGEILPNRGGADAFLASYSGADGTHRWSTSFGSTQNDRGVGLAVHGESIYLTGRFVYTMDLGKGPITGGGSFDIVLASFQRTDGANNWALPFGGEDNDYGMGVATDRAGNVYLAGGFGESVDFGDGPFKSAGQGDIVAASYGPDGMHLWSKRFGGAKNDQGNGITVSPSGNVILTGYVEESADLGQGPVAGFGNKDLFLIQL